MLNDVQLTIGFAAAFASFFSGIGLAIGGWTARPRRSAWLGAGFVIAGVLIFVAMCFGLQHLERNRLREDQAREDAAKDSPEIKRLRWIEHADVIADFRRNVEQKHDTRFVTVYGLSFGTEFPGLEDTPEIQALVNKHGSRRLESGSDVFSSSLEMQLTDQIFDYARRYNSLLLGYLEHEK